MANLAINGGNKLRKKPFPNQLAHVLDRESAYDVDQTLKRILGDKVFSRYRGNASPNFFGGEYVRRVEKEIGRRIGSNTVIAVNSCTSALLIACMAVGIKPGDEVIVTPWSMSCSATICTILGATPVFADIEYDYFCISPDDILAKITPKTKAIIAVDLFGQPADFERILAIANQRGIYVIEDAAQAIGSYYRPLKYRNEPDDDGGKRMHAGTLGHIGCFSFTQGKHFTCGEGGAIVASTEHLYRRCALIRNHAEAVVNDLFEMKKTGEESIDNFVDYADASLIGGNFRMTDIQAAILYDQLCQWDLVMEERRANANLIGTIQNLIPYIERAKPRPGVEHSYYVLPFYYKLSDVKRDVFLNAVRAELTEEEGRVDRGIPIGGGYIKPLYLMPFFKEAKHYSLAGRTYKEGDCRVCEHLWKNEFFLTLYHGLPLTKDDCEDVIGAFYKVYQNIDEIKG